MAAPTRALAASTSTPRSWCRWSTTRRELERAGGAGRAGRGGGRRGSARGVDYAVGTMIELPRAACVAADEIAVAADFFCFGTNDLTQTTLGLSRDDVEGRFLAATSRRDLRPHPVRDARPRRASASWCGSAVERGRAAKPGHQAGHLRRARRRPRLDRVLPRRRARLRLLLALPGAGGAGGGGAGGAAGASLSLRRLPPARFSLPVPGAARARAPAAWSSSTVSGLRLIESMPSSTRNSAISG